MFFIIPIFFSPNPLLGEWFVFINLINYVFKVFVRKKILRAFFFVFFFWGTVLMILWSGQATYHCLPIKSFKALWFTFVFLLTLSGVYEINISWGRGCKTGEGWWQTGRSRVLTSLYAINVLINASRMLDQTVMTLIGQSSAV